VKHPYIGVTGFTSQSEVVSVLGSVPKDADRLLMVGVLASQKTLRGQKNKWPNRYPEVGFISEIFVRNRWVLNLIHYNTKEPESLTEQLIEMTRLGGQNLEGFQLNLAWPSRDAILAYHKVCGGKFIVLQIGGKAFEMVNHSPKELAEKVSLYEHVVDYVLLDPSGGYGVPFDTEKARTYLDALRGYNLDLGLGVAGGLSPTTLNLIEPLISDFPDLSIDAEGRLRDSGDNLDLSIASQYVQGACNLFFLSGAIISPAFYF